MSDRLPIPLLAYRLVSTVAAPFTPLLLARRAGRGKEIRERIDERYGHPSLGRPKGPLVWVHGASVGELASVLPLIGKLAAREVRVLVTSGTVTSMNVAAQRLPQGAVHQFVPLDAPWFVRRFLSYWKPDLALFVESDLWPNMLIETSRRDVPMILVNARLSEHSFNRWRHLPRSISNLLHRFDLCLARTSEDAARLHDLGAPRVVTTGDLKLDVPAPPAAPDTLATLQTAIGERPMIAATSTHPGEETAVIAAHMRLRNAFPGLLTIIAPRHPDRGADVVALAASAGLKSAARSRGGLPDATTDIYVADTMGELGLFYRLAPVVFIGGSLVPHGGQNPIEAAKLGAAIVHGPHVANFTDIYAALDNAHGAEPVIDENRLTAALGALLGQPETRTRIAAAAKKTVDDLGGALDRTLNALDPYLMQLALRQRASHA